MVGNVNGIVESMYAADHARTQQSTASEGNRNFSGYLGSALLNYRTGLLTGGLGGGYGNSMYLNALSGSAWQSMVFKAIKDELEKKEKSGKSKEETDRGESGAFVSSKKKEDWATIRVIERYQSPLQENGLKSKDILV